MIQREFSVRTALRGIFAGLALGIVVAGTASPFLPAPAPLLAAAIAAAIAAVRFSERTSVI